MPRDLGYEHQVVASPDQVARSLRSWRIRALRQCFLRRHCPPQAPLCPSGASAPEAGERADVNAGWRAEIES